MNKPTNVQLPSELLRAQPLLDIDVVVWALLANRMNKGRTTVWGSRGKLMRELGRARSDGGPVDGRTVSRATRRLVASGWLAVSKVPRGAATYNEYELLGTAREDGEGSKRYYVTLSRALLARLAAGTLTLHELVAYAQWCDACEKKGWTRNTLADQVATYGGSVDKAKRLRSRLVALGLLEVQHVPGRASTTALPGRMPRRRRSGEGRGNGVPGGGGNGDPVATEGVGATVSLGWGHPCPPGGGNGVPGVGASVSHQVPLEEVPPGEAPREKASGGWPSPSRPVGDARDRDGLDLDHGSDDDEQLPAQRWAVAR